MLYIDSELSFTKDTLIQGLTFDNYVDLLSHIRDDVDNKDAYKPLFASVYIRTYTKMCVRYYTSQSDVRLGVHSLLQSRIPRVNTYNNVLLNVLDVLNTQLVEAKQDTFYVDNTHVEPLGIINTNDFLDLVFEIYVNPSIEKEFLKTHRNGVKNAWYNIQELQEQSFSFKSISKTDTIVLPHLKYIKE